jgi:hypothetical protein
MIMCLFEGITRRFPSINFLNQVFAEPFSKVDVEQIYLDISRMQGVQNPEPEHPTLETKPKKEKKPGFFKKILGKITNKTAKGSKESDRLFSSMTIVYGGPSESFEHFGIETSQRERFEAIQKRISEESLNNSCFVFQDKRFGFKPRQPDRIIITEEDIRMKAKP